MKVYRRGQSAQHVQESFARATLRMCVQRGGVEGDSEAKFTFK